MVVNERDIIDDILDNFDFEKVKKTMELLNWTWVDSTGVPSIPELRKRARSLLLECSEHGECTAATGGLWASKHTYGGDPSYRLMFVVTEWNNNA